MTDPGDPTGANPADGGDGAVGREPWRPDQHLAGDLAYDLYGDGDRVRDPGSSGRPAPEPPHRRRWSAECGGFDEPAWLVPDVDRADDGGGRVLLPGDSPWRDDTELRVAPGEQLDPAYVPPGVLGALRRRWRWGLLAAAVFLLAVVVVGVAFG